MNKIIIFPYETKNDYIGLLVKAVKMSGYVPVPQKGNKLFSQMIMYSWYENTNNSIVVFFRKIMMLLFYKMLNKKIIFILHNKVSHEKDKYSLLMMKILVHISNRIMILCEDSIPVLKSLCDDLDMKKISKVPLINYSSLVGEIEIKKEKKFRLCFFGRICAYKKVELLIEAMNRLSDYDIELTIVGECEDACYLNNLLNLIGDSSRIKLINEYVTLHKLEEIVADIDCFAIPLDLHSCLNSSSVMMGISLGRNVICPNVGTVNDIVSPPFIYGYTYDDDDSHIDALKNSINRAYNDWLSDSEKFYRNGHEGLAYVKENNSLEKISRYIRKMLDEAMGEGK